MIFPLFLDRPCHSPNDQIYSFCNSGTSKQDPPEHMRQACFLSEWGVCVCARSASWEFQAAAQKMKTALTFAIGIEIQHATGAHHGLQRDDFVQRNPEELVVVELPGGGVVCFVRTEVVVAKGKPLGPEGEKRGCVSHKLTQSC